MSLLDIEEEHTEVELELIKMTNVSRDIRIVIENILDTNELDKEVDKELVKTFSIELQSIINNIQLLPQKPKKRLSYRAGGQITQAQEDEQENSERAIQSNGFQFQRIKQERQSLQLKDLQDSNQQLTQQNQFLTIKLEQAEEYIKKMQDQRSILETQLSALKIQSLSTKISKTQIRSNTQPFYDDQQGLEMQLMTQNEQLRQQLQQSKDFILKNNQDFVRQLQKYNQKVWRLQRQLEETQNSLINCQNRIDQDEMIIQKLKQQNFNLEITTRNYRNMMSTQRPMRESNNWSTKNSQKKAMNTSRLKQFFRKQIEESSFNYRIPN